MAGEKGTPEQPVQRARWASQAESTLSLIGYSVGLGNFWRFPYLCMRNGGGAFLVPYMICMVLCGLPLMYLELNMGQFAGLGPLSIWEICPLFKGVGWGMVITSTICSIYFIVIITWGVYFLGMSLRRELPWASCGNSWNTDACVVLGTPEVPGNISRDHVIPNITEEGLVYTNTSLLGRVTAAEEFWSNKILNMSDGIEHVGTIRWEMFICFVVTWLLVWLCLSKGIRSSGKAVYVTVPLPFIMLTVLLVRGATLPGSLEGIKYYIIPDWSKLANINVWTEGCIQVFYTLGATWGGIHTMASYNRFSNSCLKDALAVTFTCSGTSIYAGFAIFSILGYMAHETGIPIESVIRQGPGLAFVGYPEALTKLPIAPFWAVCLFLAIMSLGIDGQFGMLESIVTGIVDEFPKYLAPRKRLFGAAVSFLLFLLGLPVITQGGIYIFQICDWYVSVVSVLVFGIIECITICYIYGIGNFYRDMWLMSGSRPSYFWAICWSVIIPLLLLGMLVINCVWFVPPNYGAYTYPTWAVVMGWFIATVPVIPIPVLAVYQLSKLDGPIIKRLVASTRPSPLWGPQSMCPHREAYASKSRIHNSRWRERMRFKEEIHELEHNNTPLECFSLKTNDLVV